MIKISYFTFSFLFHFVQVTAFPILHHTIQPAQTNLWWRHQSFNRQRRHTLDWPVTSTPTNWRLSTTECWNKCWNLSLLKRGNAHTEADPMLEVKRNRHVPFMSDKLRTVVMKNKESVQFSCLAVVEPQLFVHWFKGDQLILLNHRITISLQYRYGRFDPVIWSSSHDYNCGIYKAVARNKVGQTVAKARLVMGDITMEPDSP